MNPLHEKIAQLLPNARPILSTLLEGFGHRARLATVEAQEARSRLVVLALMLAGALIVACFGAFALAFTVAAAVWSSEYRLLILGIMSALALVGASTLAWLAIRKMRGWEPFGEIRRQLAEDGTCLRGILSGTGSREP